MSHSIIGVVAGGEGGGDDGGAKEQNDSDCSYRGWLDQHSNV